MLIMKKGHILWLEVLTALTVKMAVFWVVAPRRLVWVYHLTHRPDDGGSADLWNVGKHILFCTNCQSCVSVVFCSSHVTLYRKVFCNDKLCSVTWVQQPADIFMRFQVLTATSMKTSVLWDISPCTLVGIDRRFRGAYCLHNQGDKPASPKRQWISAGLHSTASQKTAIFIKIFVI
jgi:hypothetical protein